MKRSRPVRCASGSPRESPREQLLEAGARGRRSSAGSAREAARPRTGARPRRRAIAPRASPRWSRRACRAGAPRPRLEAGEGGGCNAGSPASSALRATRGSGARAIIAAAYQLPAHPGRAPATQVAPCHYGIIAAAERRAPKRRRNDAWLPGGSGFAPALHHRRFSAGGQPGRRSRRDTERAPHVHFVPAEVRDRRGHRRHAGRRAARLGKQPRAQGAR